MNALIGLLMRDDYIVAGGNEVFLTSYVRCWNERPTPFLALHQNYPHPHQTDQHKSKPYS